MTQPALPLDVPWHLVPHPVAPSPHGYEDALWLHLITDHDVHPYGVPEALAALVADHDQLHGYVRAWPPPDREPTLPLLDAAEDLLRHLPAHLSGAPKDAARALREELDRYRMGLDR